MSSVEDDAVDDANAERPPELAHELPSAATESEATPEREATHPDLAEEDSVRAAALPAAPISGASDPIGQQVAGRYTLDGLLGEGAIGRSYLAHAPDGAKVVVKLMHPSLAADENYVRRLNRELDAATKLEHLHVARTLAHGNDPALGPFVCREFLDGDDLLSALRQGAETPRRVCDFFMQLLTALSDAHRHGVVHQNLKPANVRVLRDANGHETVKVCDFGNPKRDRPGAEYMAPEQAGPLPIDGQADVYAVGVMLYEALTGEVPFRGVNARETLALHRCEVVTAPHERRPDRPVPRELEAACLKALAKPPRERHRSPREMSQALRAVISLLNNRADEPLGSRAFVDGSATVSASVERVTLPGEQLRSRTKFWLGAGLLTLVCLLVWLTPGEEPVGQPASSASLRESARGNGELALQSGTARLIAGDTEGAVTDLRNARRALGDTPEVLRALGEALLLEGSRPARKEGVAMLRRYLELEPKAEDRSFVQRLLRHAEGQR